MHRLLPVFFLLFCLSVAASAQPGSVRLLDAGGAVLDSFASIQDAYDAIPEPLTQPYVLSVQKVYKGRQPWERFPIRFRELAGSSAANTITINRPDPTQSPNLIQSGTDTAETFVFDGADWVIIDGQSPPDPDFPDFACGFRLTANPSRPARYPVIRFVNGATHNTVRFFTGFNGNPAVSRHYAPHILFDTTTAATGNSRNIIEHAYFNTDYAIRSAGSPGRPNTGNIIRHNTFERVYVNALHLGSGTAATEFSHNELNADTRHGDDIVMVLATHLEDTTRIIGNTFRLLNPARSDSAVTAIRIAAAAPAAGHRCIVANNCISSGGAYFLNHNTVYGPSRTDSTSRSLTGIAIDATAPVHALLAHNTIRLMPTTATGALRSLYSAALRISGDNTGGAVRVVNNILYNQRGGGGVGSRQVVLDIDDTSGIALDYNTYGAAASIARVGGATFTDFALYRAAFPLQDVNSNDSAVRFESVETSFLSALMTDHPALAGVPLPEVADDGSGHTRALPYRGADELRDSCNAGPYGAAIYTLSFGACPGKAVFLQYAENSYLAPVMPAGGMIHQWQRRGLSDPQFFDIPGAHAAELVTSQSEYTLYRVKDSCIGSGMVYHTNITAIPMSADSLKLDSITVEALSPVIYRFTVHHAGPADTYSWEFSNGQTALSITRDVTQWFMTPGTYTATVYTERGCSDSISITVTTGAVQGNGIGAALVTGLQVYPNPATDLLSIRSTEPLDRLLVTDLMGRVMARQDGVGTAASIATGSFPAGIYILRVSVGTEVKSLRFSVQH